MTTDNRDILFSKNEQLNFEPSKISQEQSLPQNVVLNKLNQCSSEINNLEKKNVDESENIQGMNIENNLSLNEQNQYKSNEYSDYSDKGGEEILYQEDPIFKEYTLVRNKRNKIIDDIKNISERIKNNNLKIEEIKKNLLNLKEEKKQKQIDIVNLLSNKESLEEVYKNQIYSLNSLNTNSNSGNTINENSTIIELNNLINISLKNDVVDNSLMNLNSNNNITLDNDIINNDEDTFKIIVNEIKEADQKKYIEQIVSMFEDLYKKKDEIIKTSIKNNIENEFKLFNQNISGKNAAETNESNDEQLIGNIFSKLSSFICNYSLGGKYSENKINLCLRYLLKINVINVKLTKYMKFVNKKYKEKKGELNEMIEFLEKKNKSLTDKNNLLKEDMKNYEEKLEFFGNNDVLEMEQKLRNDEELLEDNNNFKKIHKRRRKISRIKHKKSINSNDLNIIKKEINSLEGGDLSNDKSTEKANKSNNNVNNIEEKGIIQKKENNNNNANNPNEKNIPKKINNNYQLVKKNVLNIKTTIPGISDNRSNKKDLEKMTPIELEHYKRAQIIMNSGPKKNNIFGINNYNPENSIHSFNYDNRGIFSPNKKEQNILATSNKIDKTIRIGSKQNHSFISVINLTKNVPIKKKGGKEKEKEKTKIKEKTKESKGNKDNSNQDGVLQIINLEENFLNELKDEEKNENGNKTGNESTDYLTNNNDSYKNNINLISNVNLNALKDKNNNNNANNKIEVQGYYLNIINTKQQNKEKEKENNDNNSLPENAQTQNKKDNNEFFTNNNKKTLKITKSRELNINELKNNKFSIIHKKIISKTNIAKHNKIKSKIIDFKNTENKDGLLNSTEVCSKTNHRKISHNSLSGNNISNNSYGNINESKRSQSISENSEIEREKNKKINKQKFFISNDNFKNEKDNKIINVNKSPYIRKIRVASNIPFSRMKINSQNYNSYTYRKENKIYQKGL